mgnify:CR=1 FL=1
MFKRGGCVLMFMCISCSALWAQDTCTFMSYNVLNFDNTGNNKENFLITVIESIHPDILVVQELIELSGANRLLDSVILKIDTNYAMGTFINSYDTDNGIYYRKDKFDFISNTPIKTELRDINQFKLIHKSSDEIFYIYSLHLKASSGGENEILRAQEVDSLRKATGLLPDSANFIISGDFNIYGEYEDAYFALLDSSTNGFVVDPLQDVLTSTWNNSINAPYHTQSPRVRSFGGGATGGMDDRFDMMLYSKGINASGGMECLVGSLKAIGNDGNHFNDSINSLPNTSVTVDVANALHYSSDHIPITQQFIFPKGEKDTVTIAINNYVSDQFKIFPNPAKNIFTISGIKTPTLFFITDIQGKLVKPIIYLSQNNTLIDISDLQNGMYFLTAKTENGITVKKLIKEGN